MAFLPGDTLRETLPLVTSGNVPIPGATFTTIRTADPDGAEFALLYTDNTDGTYTFTVTTSTASPVGEWVALVQANDTEQQYFLLSWWVQEADRPNPHYVGDTLVSTFSVIDGTNTPLTGLTATTLHARNPLAATLPFTFDELGDGLYRVTVDAGDVTEEGTYVVLLQMDDSQSQVFELEWQVSPTTVITYATPPSGMTRQELRRAILGTIGDLTVTVATAASGSSQWTDLDMLAFGDAGRYAGRELYVTGGTVTNIGQTRAIQGSNGAGTLQLTRALPSAPTAGDEAEILNTNGLGFRIPDVHRAMETAITNAGIEVKVTATIEDAFDVETRTVEIPAVFTTIDGVHFTDDTRPASTGVVNVPRAKDYGGNGWSVDVANRQLYIGGYDGYAMDGMTLVIRGWGRPAAMTVDSDICPVNPEWLIPAVASSLLLRAVGGGRTVNADYQRIGSFYAEQADALRDAVRPRRAPNHVRLA